MSDGERVVFSKREYEEELSTPEERLEALLDEIAEQARILQTRQFDNVLEATQENDRIIHSLYERINNLPEYRRIKLQLKGSSVKVPQFAWSGVELSEDEEEVREGIAIIPSEEPFRSLDSSETITGTFSGVVGSVTQQSEGSDECNIVIGGIFALDGPETREVQLGTTGISLIDIVAHSKAYVNMADGPDIKSVELEAIRDADRLASRLSKEGLTNALFMKRLRKLQRAFHTENDHNFTLLEKIDLFKGLGRIGAMYSRRGQEQATLVVDAIMDVIGRGRQFNLRYLELFEGVVEIESKVIGEVATIVMPKGDDDVTEPALVIDADESRKTISFESISAIKF